MPKIVYNDTRLFYQLNKMDGISEIIANLLKPNLN